MRKNLHISKFFCTFAPDLENKPTINRGGNPKQRQRIMKKQSNYYWIYNSCGRRTELNPVIASNLKEAAQKAKELTKNIPGHFGVSRDYSGGVNGSAAGIKITWY